MSVYRYFACVYSTWTGPNPSQSDAHLSALILHHIHHHTHTHTHTHTHSHTHIHTHDTKQVPKTPTGDAVTGAGMVVDPRITTTSPNTDEPIELTSFPLLKENRSWRERVSDGLATCRAGCASLVGALHAALIRMRDGCVASWGVVKAAIVAGFGSLLGRLAFGAAAGGGDAFGGFAVAGTF
jgi:hypothetical protein